MLKVYPKIMLLMGIGISVVNLQCKDNVIRSFSAKATLDQSMF